MPDHLHFFVDCGNEVLLSDWMKSFKNFLSKTLKTHGHSAPHWQKGFFDHLVRSELSYGQKWDYTHQNPVRANLVAKVEDWPFQGEIACLPFS
jgi:putative transposase